jgi:Spy/CpxP family protein refolding chaperone
MKMISVRLLNATFLGAALLVSTTLVPTALRAQDQNRTYHDKDHNDDHQWNNQENQAYHVWAKDNHRKSGNFAKLKESDQQAYWNWRHEHSDAQLKIEVH